MDRRLGGPQSRSGFGGEENLGYQAHSLVNKLTELPQLRYYPSLHNTNEAIYRLDYGLEDRGSIPRRGRNFFPLPHIQTGSGAHPAHQMTLPWE